jgi:hypothetical protein
MFIELVVQDVQVPLAPPSPCSLLKVSRRGVAQPLFHSLANKCLDSKQARDLVSVLQEAKQKIDPRLAEMARYGGGGGGGRGRGGRGGWRGGYGGGHGKFLTWSPTWDATNCLSGGGGYSGSNSAPIKNSRF